MYLEKNNVIIDKNSANCMYIIFMDSGFKFEFEQFSKENTPIVWPDMIGEYDIIRAKEHDGKDISHLQGKIFKSEELKENIQKAKSFLESEDYHFEDISK